MDEITDYFIHKDIKKVTGKPTREDIKQVLDKIQEDAADVPCELGGGMHGYLGITMTGVEYATVATTTFVAYTNPGPLPTIATDATQYQIAAAKELHKKELNLFKEQRFVERSLRSKVINAFDETYLIDIKEEHIGYNNVSMPTLFNHLFKNYGKITDADLLANKETMGKHWDSDTPIQTIYKQIEDGVKFASLAGLTIHGKEKIAIAYKLIHQTGELLAACRDWRKYPDNQKSWASFKAHFTTEYQDYKDDTKQVNTSSYKANQLLQNTTSQVLNQIKSEADKDDETIKDLRAHNTYLMCQAVGRTEEVNDLQQLMKDLRQLASKLNTPTDPNKKERLLHQDFYCYCWTHVRTGSRRHTSTTCSNPQDGHDKTATIADRKKGSNVNKR